MSDDKIYGISEYKEKIKDLIGKFQKQVLDENITDRYILNLSRLLAATTNLDEIIDALLNHVDHIRQFSLNELFALN